jgi:hypothetical protein
MDGLKLADVQTCKCIRVTWKKTQIPGPHPRVSDSVCLEWACESAFVINFQLLLLAKGLHFEEHCSSAMVLNLNCIGISSDSKKYCSLVPRTKHSDIIRMGCDLCICNLKNSLGNPET